MKRKIATIWKEHDLNGISLSFICMWILGVGLITSGNILIGYVFLIEGIILRTLLETKPICKGNLINGIVNGAMIITAVIAVIITFLVFSYQKGLDEKGYYLGVKTVVYIIYVIDCWIYAKVDKYPRYIFFGLIYVACTIAGYCRGVVSLEHLEQMIGLDLGMIWDNIILPMKEAFLTIIIFDTALDNKKKKAEK